MKINRHKNGRTVARLLGAAVLLPLISGCADSNYDASQDIDMTIGLGKGLSIPIGSTQQIMMSEMIEIKEGDIIKADSASGYNYYISKNESVDPTSYNVDPIQFKFTPEQQTGDDDDVFNLNPLGGDLPEIDLNIPGLELEKYKFDFAIDTKVESEFSFSTSGSKVPNEVIKINKLDDINGQPVRIVLELYTSEIIGGKLDALHLGEKNGAGETVDSFVVCLPHFIHFAETEEYKGRIHHNASETLIDFSGLAIKRAGKTDKGYRYSFIVELPIESFEFNDSEMNWENKDDHNIDLSGTITIKGRVWHDNIQFSLAELVKDNKIELTIPRTIQREVAPIDLNINTFIGRIAPQIEEVKETVSIDMGEDLDFLKENGAVFDFAAPQIHLSVTNPAEIPLTATVTMQGERDGQPIADSQVRFDISMREERTYDFTILNDGVYENGASVYGKTDLSNLMRLIPDNISLTITPKIDESQISTVRCGKKVIEANYEIDIPLSFNSLSFSYTETVEEVLGDDPTEVTDYLKNIENMTFSLTVDNTAPFGMDLVVNAKDEKGNKLNNIKAEVSAPIAKGNGVYKQNGENNENAIVSTPIDIVLTATDGQLEKLNQLDLVLKANGAGTLNENDYVVLRDMKVTLGEDLVIDMNDKD